MWTTEDERSFYNDGGDSVEVLGVELVGRPPQTLLDFMWGNPDEFMSRFKWFNRPEDRDLFKHWLDDGEGLAQLFPIRDILAGMRTIRDRGDTTPRFPKEWFRWCRKHERGYLLAVAYTGVM